MKTTVMTAIAALAIGFSGPAFAGQSAHAMDEIVIAQGGTTSQAGASGIEPGEDTMGTPSDTDPTDSTASDATMNSDADTMDDAEGGTGVTASEEGEGATNNN